MTGHQQHVEKQGRPQAARCPQPAAEPWQPAHPAGDTGPLWQHLVASNNGQRKSAPSALFSFEGQTTSRPHALGIQRRACANGGKYRPCLCVFTQQ